jgi:hypothetical protein
VDDASCPFCGAAFDASRRDEPEYVLPPARVSRRAAYDYRHGRRKALTRAAVVAMGGAAALELSLACGGGGQTPLYGVDGSIDGETLEEASSDSGDQRDAGSDKDSGAADSGNSTDSGDSGAPEDSGASDK